MTTISKNKPRTEESIKADAKDSFVNIMRLKLLLKISALLLFIESVMILLLGVKYPYAITISFLDQETFVSKFELIGTVNSPTVIAAALLAPMVFHVIMSTTGYGSFLKDVTSNKGRFRWLNYAISNVVLLTICAVAVGFSDIVQLALMGILVLCVAAFGYINQVINMRRKHTLWDGFNAMWWLMIGLSLVIAGSLALGIWMGVANLSILRVAPIALFLTFQFIYMYGIHAHYSRVKPFDNTANSEAFLIGISTTAKLIIAALAVLSISSLS